MATHTKPGRAKNKLDRCSCFSDDSCINAPFAGTVECPGERNATLRRRSIALLSAAFLLVGVMGCGLFLFVGDEPAASLVDRAHSGNPPATREPRRAKEILAATTTPDIVTQEPRTKYALRDAVSWEPLVGATLVSEAGSFGPSGADGVVEIAVSPENSKWVVQLSKEFGQRKFPIDLPLNRRNQPLLHIDIAAKSRISLIFSGADIADAVSVVFGPESLTEWPVDRPMPERGMMELLSRSPSLMHDWLIRNGFQAGRTGNKTCRANERLVFDTNFSGVYNLAASSGSAVGTSSVEAVAGEITEGIVTLSPTGRVAGVVVDEDGQPLPGADVRIICSKRFPDGEILPERDTKTTTMIRRNKYTGETAMILERSTKTDSHGCFSWPFKFTDSILVWAFYRNETTRFSGCGHFASRSGQPRDSTNVIVVVSNGIPFGSSAVLSGKKLETGQTPVIQFSDSKMGDSSQQYNIVAPTVMIGNRVFVDMLPYGQKCTIWTPVGRAEFVAKPNVDIFVE